MAAQRLAERVDRAQQGRVVLQAFRRHQAPTPGAHHPGGMRLVDNHRRAVLPRHVTNLDQRGHVPVHRIDRLHRHVQQRVGTQGASGLGQAGLQVRDVVMAKQVRGLGAA